MSANDYEGTTRQGRRGRPESVPCSASVSASSRMSFCVWRVRKGCTRRFAGARGLLVTTDRVDAEMLASHRRLDGLESTATLGPALAELQDLVLLRRRYVDECASLGHLEQQFESKAALRLLRQALRHRVKILDKNWQAAIETDSGLRGRDEVLRSIPSMPELSTPAAERPWPCSASPPPLVTAPLTRADAKSATDAPNSAASCKMAPTAIRRNLPLATLYQHLRERDKQPKLALVALAEPPPLRESALAALCTGAQPR